MSKREVPKEIEEKFDKIIRDTERSYDALVGQWEEIEDLKEKVKTMDEMLWSLGYVCPKNT